jgi:transposase
MNKWELIRLRCLRDKQPIMQVAKEFEVAENTVRKYLRSDDPPTAFTIERPSILSPFAAIIDEYLRISPKITARRIGDLLRERHGFHRSLNERTVRKYISARRNLTSKPEVFIRAKYEPGDQAQFDFSPMPVVIAGTHLTVQLFVMRLSYSGAFFCRASVRQDRPALFSGLIESFQFFGGIPKVGIFDNAKTAVTKIQRGVTRIENEEFLAFRGALAFEVRYAAPRKGNEKGGVEGMHGYIEDNFFRPTPAFDSLDDLNNALKQFSLRELHRFHSTHKASVMERFDIERSTLRTLPEHFPRPVVTEIQKVNKFSEIVVDTNRYSVPNRYVARTATIEISDSSIRAFHDGQEIASHPRSSGKNQSVIDPMHYLDTLLKKHRALPTAAAVAKGKLPDSLLRLLNQLVSEDEISATKRWAKTLALAKEHSLDALAQATEFAMSRGLFDHDSIALVLRQRNDRYPNLQLHSDMSPASTAQQISLEQYQMSSLIECAN